MPARALRMIGIGQTFGDNALEVRIDHGAVKRPPLTDDAVGERDPALGWAFGGWAGCGVRPCTDAIKFFTRRPTCDLWRLKFRERRVRVTIDQGNDGRRLP